MIYLMLDMRFKLFSIANIDCFGESEAQCQPANETTGLHIITHNNAPAIKAAGAPRAEGCSS